MLEEWISEIETAFTDNVGRTNPLLSLAAAIVLLSLYSLILEYRQMAVLLVVSLAYMLISGAPVHRALRRFAAALPVIVPLSLITALYRDFGFASLFAMRLVGATLTATAFTLSTNMVELRWLIEKTFSRIVADNIFLMGRFLGEMYRSLRTSSLALRSRILSRHSRLWGARMVGYVLGSQVSRYIYYSQLSALGLKSRLVGPRITRRPTRIGASDLLLLGLMLTSIVAMLACMH